MVRLQVKELAQKKGMTQKALAEKSGVTVQLLNRYWNNNIQRVDLEELNKIAKALGVKPGDLIVSDGEEAMMYLVGVT
jgi:transcriptional regulator with XRE-family HTH domain